MSGCPIELRAPTIACRTATSLSPSRASSGSNARGSPRRASAEATATDKSDVRSSSRPTRGSTARRSPIRPSATIAARLVSRSVAPSCSISSGTADDPTRTNASTTSWRASSAPSSLTRADGTAGSRSHPATLMSGRIDSLDACSSDARMRRIPSGESLRRTSSLISSPSDVDVS